MFSDSALSINTWYHIAVAIDASHNATLYVNGVAQVDVETPGSLYSADGDLRIGGNNGVASSMDGRIDDVRFYDRVLSESEIDDLYQCGLAGDCSAGTGGSTAAASPDRGIQFNSGGVLTGDDALVFTSSGRMGIGAASPLAPLYIGPGTSVSGAPQFVISTTGGTELPTMNFLNQGWDVSAVGMTSADFFALGTETSQAGMQFIVGGSSTDVLETGAPAVTVLTNGNVGIGTASPNTTLDNAGSTALSGDLTPAQITADQNDYNPANLATASVLRLVSDAARTITGLAGGADGRILTIQNVGAFPLTFFAEDAASAAANRFILPGGNFTLPDAANMSLMYDATASRWRMISYATGSDSGGGSSLIGKLRMEYAANCNWSTTSGTYVSLATNDTDCNAATVSGSASAPSEGKIPAIKFASLPAGDYQVIVNANIEATYGSGNIGCYFRIFDGTSNSGAVDVWDDSSSSYDTSDRMVGTFSYASDQTDLTFYVQATRHTGTTGSCRIYNGSPGGDVPLEISVISLSGSSGGGGGASALNDLTDVDLGAGIGDSHVLTYSSAAGGWSAAASSGGVTGWERLSTNCGTNTSCSQSCSAGKKILGGGCSFGGSAALDLQNSYPSDDTTWSCDMNGGVPSNHTAHAICADAN